MKFKKNQKVLVSNDGKNWYDAYFLEYIESNRPYLYICHYGEPHFRKVSFKFCKKYNPKEHKYGPEIGHVVRSKKIDLKESEVSSQVMTPLPWSADPLGNIYSADGKLIVPLNRYNGEIIPRNTDVRYIVTACNTLPELLKQYRDLRNGIRTPARWEKGSASDDYLWTCSACKNVSEASATPRLYKYCPFCGAEMGGLVK